MAQLGVFGVALRWPSTVVVDKSYVKYATSTLLILPPRLALEINKFLFRMCFHCVNVCVPFSLKFYVYELS